MTGNFTLDSDLALAVSQHTAEIVLEGTRRLATQYAHCGPSSRVPLPDFFDAVRHCFDETMRNLARGSNMEPFPRNLCLPDEVWCMVWQDLPLADRLRVTHVCHDWRRLALSTPFIWCDVDIWVYRHEHSCKCDDCTLTPGLHPMLSRWETSERGRRFARFDRRPPNKNFAKLYKDIPRAQASLFVQLRSGHIGLNKYLHRIGAVDSPDCRVCHVPESVDHFLLSCPRYIEQRAILRSSLAPRSLTRANVLDPKHIKAVTAYAIRTRRFEHYTAR